MQERNVFLRWTRLKQASKGADADMAPAEAEQVTEPAAANGEADQAFDLASLPSIESITARTDIAAFLHSGVPAELTRAALRRAWATDPAIRDFIGIAENQWDFNDPNAIPGFGPLDPAENVADLVAQMSKGLEQVRDALADVPPPTELIPQRQPEAEQPIRAPATSAQSLTDDASTRAEPDQHGQSGSAAAAAPSRRALRHGSALPRE